MSAWSTKENPKILVLFDVDGTLTPARKYSPYASPCKSLVLEISPELKQLLEKLRRRSSLALSVALIWSSRRSQLGENGREQVMGDGQD
ncbi:hypothetical protein BASA81_017803 [Batrachochytrium salamandrivorans]|nr:hypothetical protein BASA81_017803 [Batrachochytrium salamandrivorans]